MVYKENKNLNVFVIKKVYTYFQFNGMKIFDNEQSQRIFYIEKY